MQLLAIITMVIDHIGIAMYPNDTIFRVIGRLAFPIYAFYIAQGVKYTSNKNRYVNRLIFIALISQPFYMLVISPKMINVVGSFAMIVFAIISVEKLNNMGIKLSIYLLTGIFLETFNFDYGVYGLLLVLMFYYLKSYWVVLTHLILNYIAFYLEIQGQIQFYSIVSTLVIVYYPALKILKITPTVWRIFYPAHLCIIAILINF